MKATLWPLAAAVLVSHASCVRKFNENATPSLFGGRAATAQEFPSLVDLWGPGESATQPQFNQACSAVLLTPRIVITAARCFGVGMGADVINSFEGPWETHRARLSGPAMDSASLTSAARDPSQKVVETLKARAAAIAELAADDSLTSSFDATIGRIQGGSPLTQEDLAHVASALISNKGISILKARVMPDFDGDNFKKADLALVLLAAHEKPVTPSPVSDRPVAEGETLVFAGFGLRDESEINGVHPPRTLKVASNYTQVAALTTLDPDANSKVFFAATWSPNPAREHPDAARLDPPYGLTCRGDAGGPVFRRHDGLLTLVGMVSHMAAYPSQDNCQPGIEYAKVYSRLDNPEVKKWISDTVSEWVSK